MGDELETTTTETPDGEENTTPEDTTVETTEDTEDKRSIFDQISGDLDNWWGTKKAEMSEEWKNSQTAEHQQPSRPEKKENPPPEGPTTQIVVTERQREQPKTQQEILRERRKNRYRKVL